MSGSVNHRLPSSPVVMPLGPLPAVGTGNSASIAPAGLMRPILLALYSVNQRLPSIPVAMLAGALPAVVTANSAMTPSVVIRPIWLPPNSVNHTFPSRPAAIPAGMLPTGPNSLMAPAVVIRPIRLPLCSVNQRFPSGPETIAVGPADADGIDNSVITPAGLSSPIAFADDSVVQRVPPGPEVIQKDAQVRLANSVIAPAVLIWPILVPPVDSANQMVPSAPVVIPCGVLAAVGIGTSAITVAEAPAARGVKAIALAAMAAVAMVPIHRGRRVPTGSDITGLVLG